MPQTSEDTAELFNTYFAEQSNLEDEGRRPDTSDIEQAETHLENIHSSNLTVNSIMRNLNMTKASGSDETSPRVLKQISNAIAPILATIFNFYFQMGSFWKIWKKANVSRLFKNKGK